MRTTAALAAVLVLVLAAPALAVTGSDLSLEVLVDGRPLAELAARGTTYVEALAGREYALRLTNHTPRRLAVALAVDGLNTIDARHTSAREARKWVLAPHESVLIEGWQTGADTARRFVFTTEERSYGAWLGQTADLGAITAAVFRERVRRPPAPYLGSRERSAPSGGADADAAAPEAPSGSAKEAEGYAATGIGRELDNPVVQVAMDLEPRPSDMLALRYEYRDALVRLGVLPEHLPDRLARRERAGGFAPDPGRPIH